MSSTSSLPGESRHVRRAASHLQSRRVKSDPFGIAKGPPTHEFGCDVKVNTNTKLVAAFPSSSILTHALAVGQPSQLARFEFSKRTKHNAAPHGRRADVTFVA